MASEQARCQLGAVAGPLAPAGGYPRVPSRPVKTRAGPRTPRTGPARLGFTSHATSLRPKVCLRGRWWFYFMQGFCFVTGKNLI